MKGEDAQVVTEDGGLMPRPIRRLVVASLGVLTAIACYLFIVRGPALLYDLAEAIRLCM